MTQSAGALEGVGVVDFSKFLPGPYCSWMLAELGADVIRVEHPREVAKQEQVFGWDRLPRSEVARLRAQNIFARGKRSILLDPSAEGSKDIIHDLVRRADVLVEDYRPGVMDRMGLGYERMAGINPRLVYCSVTLAGQTGPYRDRPGHDPIALSVAGALSRIGEDGAAPQFPGVPVADLLGGSNAVIGVLAALIARQRTGTGQQVDIAMSDSAMALIASILWRNPDLTALPPRDARRTDTGIWKTSDGRFLCTTDMEPAFWERFCRALGRPDLIPGRLDPARRETIIAEFAAIFASQPLDHWMSVLGEAGTQYAPVLSVAEALEDPHNLARGMVFDVTVPGGGQVRQIGCPIKLSSTPAVKPVAAGVAGAQGEAILRELGYDAERIAAATASADISPTRTP